MKRSLWVAAMLLTPGLLGCEPDLGECDIDEARRVVYDLQGNPAFEGQALMISSCGGGSFCHSPGAQGAERHGVPIGQDYDLALASNSSAAMPEETERLRENQQRAFDHRHLIWAEVDSGRMPVPGLAGQTVLGASPRYSPLDVFTRERSEGVTIAEPAGRAILRNWLACDLPVIERTEVPPSGSPGAPIGYVYPLQEDPLLPEWGDIYARLIAPRCANASCHGAMGTQAELELVGQAESLAALLAQSASAVIPEPIRPGCYETGRPLLTPGDAEGSLFYQKLTGVDADGEPICGARMPSSGAGLSEPSLAAIRDWINAM